MSPGRPNLWRILSDTSRIISDHSRHFLALSILFIFPISFASAIYTLLLHPNPVETLYVRFLNTFSMADYEIPPLGKSQLLLQLLYSLSTLFFSTCATASITYSIFHGFYGSPVEFISALKSILVSFLPLLATTLLVEIFIALIISAYMAFLLLAYNALASIGLDMDYYHNEYFLVFYIAMAALLVALLIFLQIEWSVTNVVVVVESDWGLAALKRSSYLVKGARGVMFLMLLFFGVLAGVMAIGYLNLVANAAGGWSGWLVVKIIVAAAFSTVLSLYALSAVTVFFIYCKASHHEGEFEIDDKLGGEYVRLPYDVNVV